MTNNSLLLNLIKLIQMQTVKPQFFISYVWRMRYIFPEFLRKIFKSFHVSQNNWTEITEIASLW